MVNYKKEYIAAFLRVSVEGDVKPVAVEWTDGTVFKIDKVTDCRNSPPDHTGGVLTKKYRVIIKGREKTLYYEKQTGRWFVEISAR